MTDEEKQSQADEKIDRPDKPREPWSMEKALERAAKAVEKTMVDRLLEKVAEEELDLKEFDTFYRELRAESDRALAVISFAYIDERLSRHIGRVLNDSISGGVKSLFDGFGALATASSRIQMAAALYWITPTTYRNLGLMRKIRNEFTHNPFCGGFNDRRISGYMGEMDPIENPLLELLQDWISEDGLPSCNMSEVASGRELFMARSILTCKCVIEQLSSAPHAQRIGLPSFAAFGKGFDSAPEAHKELARVAAGLALDAFLPAVRRATGYGGKGWWRA